MTPDDMTLVRQFVTLRSEHAFSTLVERHIGLVHSLALRQTGDPLLAEEITQAVFIILARKAPSLRSDTIVPAWLYRAARYASANALKIQHRRRKREHEAYMQSTLERGENGSSSGPDDQVWNQLAPFLDDALDKLSYVDRAALMLRYFENRSWREIADAMQLTEDAAQKRASRALEKLRSIFDKRGVTLTTAVIAGAVSSNSAQAAPAATVKTIAALATSNAPAAHTATLTIAQATMKTMTWLRYKLVMGVSATAVAIAGITTIALAQPQPTVYSLLEKPPIILSATYERELFSTNILAGLPAGSQKAAFTFSFDGADYKLKFHSAGFAGKYGDVYWRTMGDQITRFDTKLNNLDGVENGVVFQNQAAQGCINNLVSGGLAGAKIKNFKWENGHRKATFDADDGFKHYFYAVEFAEERGLPASATLRDAKSGVAYNFLTYRYDPKFCRGQFPIEITCYSGDKADEKAKYVVFHVKSMELSRNHLAADILDPAKFVPTTNAHFKALFFSNNIEYLIDKNGQSRRLLNDQQQADLVEKYRKRAAAFDELRRASANQNK